MRKGEGTKFCGDRGRSKQKMNVGCITSMNVAGVSNCDMGSMYRLCNVQYYVLMLNEYLLKHGHLYSQWNSLW